MTVLQICEDHAEVLTTKERVPFHILIEVAMNESDNKFEDKSANGNKDNQKHSEFYFNSNENKFVLETQMNTTTSQTEDKNKTNSSIFSFGNLFKGFSCCFGKPPHRNEEDEEEEEIPKYKHITPDTIGLFGGKTFKSIQEKLLNDSTFKKAYTNRKIVSLIVKGADDMRQDQFVSQIIELFKSIFDKEQCEIFLTPLNVLATGRGGIIQTFPDTTNLNKIKSINHFPQGTDYDIAEEKCLLNYYTYKFGENGTPSFERAINNFILSLVGYSLLCYFLEVKDRNNGNILFDADGHMIHIDFGFLLASSPGNVNFEKAPFKLTIEFVELMQGVDSPHFKKFVCLFTKAFEALKKNSHLIISFAEIFILTNSDLSCFKNSEVIIPEMKAKFELNDDEVKNLILLSLNNWRTKAYDKFQKYCVGIN